MQKHGVNVWLVNTGWANGPYGVGSRVKLKYTRAMITAALNGDLDQVEYSTHTIFGMQQPKACPDVPTDILSPKASWNNDEAFYKQANKLAKAFIANFEKYKAGVSQAVINAAPKVNESVSA
jgi:phosphoenolpyruvate carboxykinase (ATP)